ncbi:hypothetical protein CerSpe_113480 [Prunus speciosa]
MTDEELLEYLLDGLGHEYKEFTTSLHLRPSLSFDEFYNLLVQEEQLINKMSVVLVSTDVALAVDRSSTDPQTHFNIERRPPNNTHWYNGYRGQGRGRRGGGWRSNRNNKWSRRWVSNDNGDRSCLPSSDNRPPLLPTPTQTHYQFDVICQQCDKPSHTSRVCPQSGNFAYVAAANEKPPSLSRLVNANWVVDLGATHHMT